MPDYNVKSYNELVETLKKMLEGVRARKSDEGFPSAVKEETLRKWISTLETQRAAAEKSQTKARQDMDEYNTSHKSIDKDAARFKTMLYGFYGKTSLSIREFGMKPFKSGRPAKKKETV